MRSVSSLQIHHLKWKPFDIPLPWRLNKRDNVSNHQLHDCLLNRLHRRRSKKTSKLRVTGLCGEISPLTGEFPAQMVSNAENVSIRRRHHANVSMVSEWPEVYSTPQHQSDSGPVHFRHGSGMFSWSNVDTVININISVWCILILTFNKRPVPGIRHPDSRIWHPVCHRKGRLMDEYIRFKSDHT